MRPSTRFANTICYCALAAGIVLAVQSPADAHSLTPSALTFTVTAGGGAPASQSMVLDSDSKRRNDWSAASDKSWIQVSPTTGTIRNEKDTLTIQVNPSGIAAGIYTGTVQVTLVEQPGGLTTSVSATVTLNITSSSSTSPSIALSPTSLSFSGTAGGTVPTAKTLNLTNPNGGSLSWNISSSTPWLLVTPTTGTTGTETDQLSVSANTTGMGAGTYNGILTVGGNGSNAPQQIQVSLSLTSGMPTTTSATLSWNANTESDMAGYKVYYGTASRNYTTTLNVGNVTTYTVNGLPTGQTYYFAVTAFDQIGNESGKSAEASVAR